MHNNGSTAMHTNNNHHPNKNTIIVKIMHNNNSAAMHTK